MEHACRIGRDGEEEKHQKLGLDAAAAAVNTQDSQEESPLQSSQSAANTLRPPPTRGNSFSRPIIHRRLYILRQPAWTPVKAC